METERLIIKRPSLEDTSSLMAIRNSHFVLKYNCMEPLDFQKTQKMLSNEIQQGIAYHLYDKNTFKLIGAVYFGEDDLRFGVHSCSLSYFLAEQYANQGYMSEALNALLPIQPYDIITCCIFKDNIASIKLIEKLGFRYEGCLKKAVRGYRGIIHDDCLYALESQKNQGN